MCIPILSTVFVPAGRQNLTAFMTELCRRYDGQAPVRWLDVINETVLPNGQWHGPKKGTDGWECPWTAIGFDEEHPLRPPLFIRLAFEIANRHAPSTKLIINQHGGMEEAMWGKVRALVPYLRGQGLRVRMVRHQEQDVGLVRHDSLLFSAEWLHGSGAAGTLKGGDNARRSGGIQAAFGSGRRRGVAGAGSLLVPESGPCRSSGLSARLA